MSTWYKSAADSLPYMLETPLKCDIKYGVKNMTFPKEKTTTTKILLCHPNMIWILF